MYLTERRRRQIRGIYDHYGKDQQYSKLMEELGELISAMATGTEEEVISEIADVEIMLEQIKDGLGIRAKVCGEIDYKLKRQLVRMGVYDAFDEPESYDCASLPPQEVAE